MTSEERQNRIATNRDKFLMVADDIGAEGEQGGVVADAVLSANSDEQERDRQLSATVAGLAGIGPKDELEGMMAAQLIEWQRS